MTPAARVQAAIELLDSIVEAARDAGPAADTIIAAYFRTRRYAGSGDRRAVRDLVYRAIRRAGERPASGRAAMLGLAQDSPELLEAFNGAPHCPGRISQGEEIAEAAVSPAWLAGRFDPLVTDAEMGALLERAPLDLRVNRLKGALEDGLAALPGAEPTPHSPIGLRLADGIRVEDSPAWRSGLIEVQDEGSQLLSLACGARPGMTLVDLCAGAGGKTLALGAEMGGEGRIVAADTDRGRLSRMRPRLERSGLSIVEARLLDPGREREALADLAGRADITLIDAPCSGSGTWRRNPETRWRLNQERLERLLNLQAYLLEIAEELVKPGGWLIYCVCSLLADEGRNQAELFSNRSALVPQSPSMNAGRDSGVGRLLTPGHDGTDGFFVARWQAPC